ncbi:MAG: SRPBCC family protein [Actinobacteria bacterium]|nr:SRPBCC family protein [Actinomycetota bacterium]
MPTASSSTTFTTPTDREVVATRMFDAPRELVWDAVTKPEHLRQWMLGPDGWEMPICEIDLQPGGAYRYGWAEAGTGANPFELSGEFREIDPPERIVHTEQFGGEGPEAIITLELVEEAGKTRMTTTMLYPSKEIRDQVLETGMTEGAGKSYDRLADYLDGLGD